MARAALMRRGRAQPDAGGAAQPQDLVGFYEKAYKVDTSSAELYARWRGLGAVGKADHVTALCRRAGVLVTSTLEVGCGDGALLCELHRRGFGGRLTGVELSEAAAAIARTRAEINEVYVYDGARLPATGAHDLGILSHVLEHVVEPAALLAEVARACSAVVVEVPLEANLSARRSAKRAHAAEIGHLQRLERADVRAVVARAGLHVACELEDPLPRAAHAFFAVSTRERAAATFKWALRRALHGTAPGLSRRLFTVHYACLCVPARTHGERADPASIAGS